MGINEFSGVVLPVNELSVLHTSLITAEPLESKGIGGKDLNNVVDYCWSLTYRCVRGQRPPL